MICLAYLFYFLQPFNFPGTPHFRRPPDQFYWGVKYNDSLLYDRDSDSKLWSLTISRFAIKSTDSIELFVYPDCCWDPPIAVFLKDTSFNFIRRFENTGKVAVMDVLKYAPRTRKNIWILWSSSISNKGETIIWDDKRTYPIYRNNPRLLLNVTD